MVEVEIEIGKERADRRGERRRKEHDRRGQEHHTQEIAQDADREEGSRRLHLRDGAKQPPEKDEITPQEQSEDDGDENDARDRRGVKRSELGEANA